MTSAKASKPRRNYSPGTVAALLTLARGGCYWPNCNEPTIRMVEGEPVQNLQIAHIRALEQGGKRFDPAWSEAERNSFANLILLCTPHHKVVDGPRSDEYPLELLVGWKQAREADGLDALEGLGDLTKTDLGEMIAEAQHELMDRLGPALDEFAKTAPELASLLKLATSELADPRIHGFGISEDTAWLLHESARSLAGLEDNALTLANAAHGLRNLETNAATLANAADTLTNLEANAATLANASSNLKNLETHAWELKDAAQEVNRAAQALRNARFD